MARGPRRPPALPRRLPLSPPPRAPASRPWAPRQRPRSLRSPRPSRPHLSPLPLARGACCSSGRAPGGHRRRVPGLGSTEGPGRRGLAERHRARGGTGRGLRVTGTASGLARGSIRPLPAACSAVALGSAPEEASFGVTQLLPGSSDLASRLPRAPPRELTRGASRQRLCPGDAPPAGSPVGRRGRCMHPWAPQPFLEQGTDCAAPPRGIRFWRHLRDCPTFSKGQLGNPQRLSVSFRGPRFKG